jgi:chorismate dehydratase
MPIPLIGCVPYLNARPLVTWFETDEGRTAAEVVTAVPSRLAEWLRQRRISAAMLSSVEAFRRPNAVVAPGAAIVSRGPVQSVRLFSRGPWEQVRTVALDQSSLTACALTKILLSELHRVEPTYLSSPPDLDKMLLEADAALLIGDPGMSACADGLNVLDLGEGWTELTRLPFVWAVWLVNEDDMAPAAVSAILRAREYGIERLEVIAAAEAARLGWSVELCRDYLTNTIQFDLAEEELEGLSVFRHYCEAHNVLAAAQDPRLFRLEK